MLLKIVSELALHYILTIFFKMGHPQPVFHLFFAFSNNNTDFATNQSEKLST